MSPSCGNHIRLLFSLVHQNLGSIHTNSDIFETKYLFMRIGPVSTRNQVNPLNETALF